MPTNQVWVAPDEPLPGESIVAETGGPLHERLESPHNYVVGDTLPLDGLKVKVVKRELLADGRIRLNCVKA